MADEAVNKYLARYEELLAEKAPWNAHYQRLAEIFLTRKSNFTQVIAPGAFLQDEVFDNTGQFAAYLMASVFLSMLWPDSTRTFVLRPVRRLRDLPGVEEYFRFATEEMRQVMDNSRAGLSLALMEHFLDQAVFGTSGIGVFEGPENDPALPVVYEAWGVKNMCIAENAQGFVDTVFFMRTRTVRQVMEEYGAKDVVSPKVRELFNGGRVNEPVDILQVIEPKIPKEGAQGVAAMSCRTCHLDKTNRVIMRESGFQEMPVFVARFFKALDEVYARSAGMTALPDAVSLNVLSESVLVATEKQLDPPLGVLDDGRMGGGVINTSAGEINVFNTSGRLATQSPIFPLYTVGELLSAEKQQARLEQKIMQAFFLDRLLDLNNQTQMTAFETSVRNRMRGESLSSLFARQEMEVLTPMIQRTFNILYRGGRLGVVREGAAGKIAAIWNKIIGTAEVIVPDVVLKAAAEGLDVFEIEYISPAKRFMQSEKLQGVLTVVDLLTTVGPVIPGFMDNYDIDELARVHARLAGAPEIILRPKAAVTDIRARVAAQQMQAQMLDDVRQVSEVGRNAAQAVATLAGSGSQSGGGRSK